MIVRRLAPDDWPTFKTLRLASLRDAPDNFAQDHDAIADDPPDAWQAALKQRVTYAAFDDSTPIGLAAYIADDPSRMSHRAHLINVWVDPAWRGAGRAEALVRAVEEAARSDGILQFELEVNAENARAVAFYHRLGYQTVGRIPRAFRTPTGFLDDFLMVRALDRT
ncbi:MAG: GNAT family N-acetyltransferase [Silicimonas sp.]|nr:GNAT family N-acetyltransferase [Silicimonas sp.]